jgi:hypothetical protein
LVHRNRHVFDTIVRIIAGTFLLVSAACAALGQNPVPLINQPLVPDAAKPGGAAFTLTVNGFGFVAGSVVHWNGAARPSLSVGLAGADYGTESAYSSVVVGDFNRDGKLDFAVANTTIGTRYQAVRAPGR